MKDWFFGSRDYSNDRRRGWQGRAGAVEKTARQKPLVRPEGHVGFGWEKTKNLPGPACGNQKLFN